MPSNRTRKLPGFSERMALGGLDAFAAPSTEPTWTDSHHKHTLWLSDEVWAALGARAAQETERSKSSVVEEALRQYLGL